MEKLVILDAVVAGKMVDFALFIWEVMKDFVVTMKPMTNLPYGNLVTRMCKHFKVKAYTFDQLTPLETGAIGKASSKKRKAISKGERAKMLEFDSETPEPSSSTGPPSTAPARSIPQRLDTLEVIVHEIEALVQSMTEMLKEIFMHTFPGRPIPEGPTPPVTGTSASAPSASTMVEEEEDEESDESEESEDDDDGEGDEE